MKKFKEIKITVVYTLLLLLFSACEQPPSNFSSDNTNDPFGPKYSPQDLTNLQYNIRNLNEVELKWDKHIGAEYYRIERIDLLANSSSQVIKEKFVDTVLTDKFQNPKNIKYKVSVIARNDSSTSATTSPILTNLLEGPTLDNHSEAEIPLIATSISNGNIINIDNTYYDILNTITGFEFNKNTLEWAPINLPTLKTQNYTEYYFKLSNDKILLYGSEKEGNWINLLIDPRNNTIQTSKSSSFFQEENIIAQYGISFVELKNENVLITAIKDPNTASYLYSNYTAIYDKNADTLISINPMQNFRAFHESVTLQNGNVLVCGGQFIEFTNTGTPSCELLDISTKQWETLNSSPVELYVPIALKLNSGNIFWIDAHHDRNSVFIYNPDNREWLQVSSTEYQLHPKLLNKYNYSAGNLNREFNNSIIKLDSNRILALTRNSGKYYFEIFDVSTTKWLKPIQLPHRIKHPTSLNLLGDNKLLLTHVNTETDLLNSEIYYLE